MFENNPWLSIWLNPRSTIRKIVGTNPNRSLWILSFIYGFLSLLNSFHSISVGNIIGVIPIFAITLILSPFWGYAVFSVWSWVIYRVGRWLKGVGSFSSVRAAFAWSCVPLTINIVFWFLMIGIFGASVFFANTEIYPMGNQQTALLFLILIGKVVIAIWSLVIYLNMLAEVQKFSILKAIFNLIISWVLIGVFLSLVWFAFIFLVSMGSDSSNLTFQFLQEGITLEFLRGIL